MPKRDAMESKDKILRVAEQVFSEMGYDGARVDDIAARAGVNKALIYYYFKNKQHILDSLFDKLIQEAEAMLNQSLRDSPNVGQEETFKLLITRYLEFVSERKSILRVVLTEALKASSESSVLMRLGELIMKSETENIRKMYESKGAKYPYVDRELIVMEFFTGVMPLINYAVFQDQWSRYYDMDGAELRDKFIEAFRLTHLASHFSRPKQQ